MKTKRRHGLSVRERIERAITVDDNGCWRWNLLISRTGYAYLSVCCGPGIQRNKQAHRLAYREWKGPIPEGYEVDHLCYVSDCVNPDHLEAVTPEVNIARRRPSDRIGAHNRVKTHCPQGHPYGPDSTYIAPGSTSRACRTCKRQRSREKAKR